MIRFFCGTARLMGFFFCLLLALLAYLSWGNGGMLVPLTPLPAPKGESPKQRTLLIPPKSNFQVIGQLLVQEKFLPHPFGFYVAVLLTGKYAALKAGEYEIAPNSTPLDWVLLFVSGKTLRRFVTIPEGFTVAQAAAVIANAPVLVGEVGPLPPEGSLFPDTYDYQRGEKRSQLLQRMKKAMDKKIAALWAKRDLAVPLTSLGEALILASLIEQETPQPSERVLVAGVFYNRLKLKMRLQSDPTVSYGLTLGKKSLERPLTFQDLKNPSPFNTYVIAGLPPTPIACPGEKSLYAALHPEKTQALYFVADGRGGHVFASTFAEHTKNVAQWRKIQKKRQ